MTTPASVARVRQVGTCCGLALLLALPAFPGLAATYRYASSSNRIYVENGGTVRLSDIRAALPGAPLRLVDATNRIWLLEANLILEDGVRLNLYGASAGGDVNELRIRSNNNSSGFVYVSAEHGWIDILATRIRSWNTAANAPDSDYSNGRAFIRVRSRLASDGVTALESRMDIVSSQVSDLGYNAAESYGLVWKVTGAQAGLYDKVQVRGNIHASHIHHNYYGVYTFGHQDGVWTDNEIDHNAGYGFDPHDDSDNLLIENNDVHDNGNHGIIASKRCDHVVIRGNRAYGNAGNGIMLHRSSDDGLVEDNESYLNEDSGIAIFASRRTVIRNNTLLDNANAGMRFSMGASDSRVSGNQIGYSGKYGLYFYRGSDTPEPGDDGRPKRNTFSGNTVHDSGEDAIKMSDSDANTFTGNTFRANGLSMRFATSTKVTVSSNAIPSNVTLRLSGTSSVPTVLDVQAQGRLALALDRDSRANFRDSAFAIFDTAQALYTVATTSGSLLALDAANTGGATTVYTRRLNARPSAGSVQVNPTLWDVSTDRSKHWSARVSASTVQVAYTVGDLLPGVAYAVFQAGTRIGTFTASAAGSIAFTVTPGTTATLAYSVDPA